MNLATQGMGLQIDAVIWPACQCGAPYAQHTATGCQGYRPSRPVRHLGTRGFRAVGSLALWRRVAANGIWIIESTLTVWRERIARS